MNEKRKKNETAKNTDRKALAKDLKEGRKQERTHKKVKQTAFADENGSESPYLTRG